MRCRDRLVLRECFLDLRRAVQGYKEDGGGGVIVSDIPWSGFDTQWRTIVQMIMGALFRSSSYKCRAFLSRALTSSESSPGGDIPRSWWLAATVAKARER